MGNGGGIFNNPVVLIILLIVFFYVLSNAALFMLLVIVAIGYFCIRLTAAGGTKGYRKPTSKTKIIIQGDRLARVEGRVDRHKKDKKKGD